MNKISRKLQGFTLHISIEPEEIEPEASIAPPMSPPNKPLPTELGSPNDEQLYARKQASEIALVSPSTLDRKRRKGLPFTKIGHLVFYKYKDLMSIRKEIRLRGIE